MTHINPGPIFLGVISFSVAVLLWSYKSTRRTMVWFFATAAFLLFLGFELWADSLSQVTANWTGLLVLLALLIVSCFGMWLEGIKRHRFHRIRTPAIGIMFGTVLPLFIGSTGRVMSTLGKSAAGSARAFGTTVTQVNSGQAAQAVSHHQALIYVGVGAASMLALLYAGYFFENRNPRGRKGGGGIPAQITAAQAASGRPGGAVARTR